MRYGNTYVGYDVSDYETKRFMTYLKELMKLMDVKYAIKYPFGSDESYYLVIKSEDEARAKFIKKFIDNGYKLTW